MAYRETYHYVVLCDRCGIPAPEGTGWWTPAIADHAAIEAGWMITTTEHLCRACSALERADEAGGGDPADRRPALMPVPRGSAAARRVLGSRLRRAGRSMTLDEER